MSIANVTRLCLLGLGLGCASELEEPERFDFLLDGGAGDAGMMMGGMDAGGGEPDAAEPEPDAAPMDELPACVRDVFEATCAGAACHGAGAALLDVLSPGVADRLVGEPASPTGLCSGRTYIEPGGDSLLLDKLGEDPACGERMPYGALPLDDDQVQCLTDWVMDLGGSGDP